MAAGNPIASTRLLTVGEVARRSGVAVSTLHFYETKGLISSLRSEGNQRRYQANVLRAVAIIKVAQRTGISLEEIKTALGALPGRQQVHGGAVAGDFVALAPDAGRTYPQTHAVARRVGSLHWLRLPVAAGLPAAQSGRCVGPGGARAAHS